MASSNVPISSPQAKAGTGGYSSVVRLFVIARGERIPLAQVGAGRMYFDAPTSLPRGPAELIVEIDGEPHATAVMVPQSSAPSRIIEYSTVELPARYHAPVSPAPVRAQPQ